MNKNSNTYIIVYSAIMVIVVASVLTLAAIGLKEKQAENVRIEKMSDILRSVGLAWDADKASDKTAYITELYNKHITDAYAVNVNGDRIDDVDAFTLLIDLKNEYDKEPEERRLPVFTSDNQGVVSHVLPLWGAGLWGPVWGYVALSDDWNTIKGVVFDHQGETPGLGAEIANAPFQNQFQGKEIIANGKVVGISLLKGGGSAGNLHAVDGLSGGTLTGHGVEKMIKDNLTGYSAYIQKQIAGGTATTAAVTAIADTTVADAETAVDGANAAETSETAADATEETNSLTNNE